MEVVARRLACSSGALAPLLAARAFPPESAPADSLVRQARDDRGTNFWPAVLACCSCGAAALALSCFPNLEGLTVGTSEDGGPRDAGGDRDSRIDSSPQDSRAEDSPAGDAGTRDSLSPHDARPEADATPCSPDLETDTHNCGACGHDCLGTTCSGGICESVVLAQKENQPTALTLDSTNLYWTDFGTSASSYDDQTIRACAKDGCAQTPTTLAPSAGFSYGIAVNGTHLYWTEDNSGLVVGCTLPSCSTPTHLATGQDEPYGVVTDPSGATLLWTNNGESGMGDGTVMSCSLPSCSSPTPIATGLDYPSGIVANASHVYFADEGTSAKDGIVYSCPLSGCGASPTVIQGGQLTPFYVATSDASLVWASTGSGVVSVCPLAGCGGDPTTLAMGQANPYAVAIDASDVYWTNYASVGQVMTCPIAGCPAAGPTVLATSQAYPAAVVVDAQWVYWINSGLVDSSGSVMKVAK
jgi:hypothetical protein